jgi:hypothetical protein
MKSFTVCELIDEYHFRLPQFLNEIVFRVFIPVLPFYAKFLFSFYTYFSFLSCLLSFIISLSPFFCPYRANLPMFTACLSYLENVFVMSSSQFLLFILFVSLFSLSLRPKKINNIEYNPTIQALLTLPDHGFSGISLQCRPSPCPHIYVRT